MFHTQQSFDIRGISNSHKNYNTAIVTFNDKLLTIARSQDSLLKPSCITISQITKTNDKYIVNNSYILPIQSDGYSVEDPRAQVVGKHLYIFWNTGAHPRIKHSSKYDYSLYVTCVDKDFNIVYTKPLFYSGRKQVEKNWLPFYDWNNHRWLCLYSSSPWVILEFNEDWKAREFIRADINLPWHWGDIRGGTCPVKIAPPSGASFVAKYSQYYTWFHSSYQHPVKELNLSRHYVSGLLSFSTDTFLPTGISRFPVIEPHPRDKSAVNSKVVFPGGALYSVQKPYDKWIISYGVGDRWTRVDEISHKEVTCKLNWHTMENKDLTEQYHKEIAITLEN